MKAATRVAGKQAPKRFLATYISYGVYMPDGQSGVPRKKPDGTYDHHEWSCWPQASPGKIESFNKSSERFEPLKDHVTYLRGLDHKGGYKLGGHSSDDVFLTGADIGATGVILDPAKSYFECRHVGLGTSLIDVDVPVGIVKGRYFAVATEKLHAMPFMPLECEDDIIALACAGGGVIAACLQQRFRELSTGKEASFRRPIHAQAREIVRRQYLCTPSGS